MAFETLKFDLTLSGTYWHKKPEYSIWIDDEEIERKVISTFSDELFTVSFSKKIEETSHQLRIRLENKVSRDTEILEDGSIGRDMLLNVENIVIDDIDIGNLKWTISKYVTDKPVDVDGETTNELESCINLGWNGSYIIDFECPYYLWLLENL
jgi:hypothetical protein|tara:strand:+ start:1511 stop:1969 length:459 start_codon:yes stop_codon:yes gene_type:complete